MMNIEINTDHNIQGSEALIGRFSNTIETYLSKASDQITHVIVYLSDENGEKKTKNDKRCKIEARLEGRMPIVVIDDADSLSQALEGALAKLENMLEKIIGKQRNKPALDNKK